MTYEEVKRIRNEHPARGVDNHELARMIDAAIEKQIPKKPILIEDKMYCCPNKGCWNNLLFKYKVYPNVLNEKKGLRFCLACGQRIDWEEGAEE